MSALVLEGGTFRPIFSAGVMDALLDNDIHFPYVIGVSAGITDGVSYVSKQKKRNYDILVNLRHDKRYIGMRNFLTDRSMFGIKFVYEDLPKNIYPFDWKTYRNSATEVRVGVTDVKTGTAQYLNGKDLDEKCTMLKATCALPFVFPVIKLNGNEYYDGGICDPIPVRKAIQDGHNKLLIVLTRPKSYRKKLSATNKLAAKYIKRKYPNLAEPLLTRHIRYNETVRFCKQLEQEGKAVLLRPTEEVQIDSFEKDIDKIKQIYQFGYNSATERIDEIKELLK